MATTHVGGETYENPFRKPVEGVSGAYWVIGGVVLGLYGSASMIPATPMYAIAVLMGMHGIRDLYNAWHLWERHANLRIQDILFMTPDQMMKQVRKGKAGKGQEETEDALWLGYGFTWESHHAQRAYELKKRGPEEYQPPGWFHALRRLRGKGNGTQLGGRAWIHGLELNETDITLPPTHAKGHTFVLGSTRTGKTRFLESQVTQAIHRGNGSEPVIILDPKGDTELLDRARRECAKAGRADDFFYFHPAFPEDSVRIDPLANYNRPSQISSRVNALIESETSDVFATYPWWVVEQTVAALLRVGLAPRLTLVRRYVEGGPDKLMGQVMEQYLDETMPDWFSRFQTFMSKRKKGSGKGPIDDYTHDDLVDFYVNEVQGTPDEDDDINGIITLYTKNREHLNKLIAALIPVLTMLTKGSLKDLLSPDPEDTDDPRPILDSASIVNRGRVLYVGLDNLSDPKVGSAIGSMLLADITSVAGDRYNFGSGDRVNLFLDEAAELINESFITMLNKGAGAGFQAYVAAQTVPDFAAKLGNQDKANQIIGNLNNLIAFRVNDPDTLDYLSKKFGKIPIKQRMQTQATSAISGDKDPTNYTTNYGERLVEAEVETFAPELMGQLPNLNYVAMLSGQPYKGRIPILQDRDK